MKKSVAIFLILFLFFINPVTGIILCMGENGHMAIEPKTDSDICCSDTLSDHSKKQTQAIDPIHSEECGACWDIPISLQNDFDINLVNGLNLSKFLSSISIIQKMYQYQPEAHFLPYRPANITPNNLITSALKTIRLII